MAFFMLTQHSISPFHKPGISVTPWTFNKRYL